MPPGCCASDGHAKAMASSPPDTNSRNRRLIESVSLGVRDTSRGARPKRRKTLERKRKTAPWQGAVLRSGVLDRNARIGRDRLIAEGDNQANRPRCRERL